jgi:hypothetical protein
MLIMWRKRAAERKPCLRTYRSAILLEEGLSSGERSKFLLSSEALEDPTYSALFMSSKVAYYLKCALHCSNSISTGSSSQFTNHQYFILNCSKSNRKVSNGNFRDFFKAEASPGFKPEKELFRGYGLADAPPFFQESISCCIIAFSLFFVSMAHLKFQDTRLRMSNKWHMCKEGKAGNKK